ncbi:MAG TPA: ATP-dependent Clp protease adaptor ClpS [Polyangia bacterium]|jgi:ATP-dependent Clp protease adaptor protein ClpS|nr:ATP-dependent Clp protease adaptor ClpS [Polyangia bacterium]
MPKRPDKTEDLETLSKPKEALGILEKPKVERPPLYEVLLHNDDYTTQEFVVYILMKFFRHDSTAAHQIMLHVHTKGIGVAGIFPYDVAETKVHQVMQFAREHEMPLQCSLRRSSQC